jgi:Fe-S-cluster containining protein
MERPNPCITCGACCAHYRVSFYWAEADDATPQGVPVRMTKKLSEFRRYMIGTDGKNRRCIALQGEIGKDVHCSIYEQRPSPCLGFEPSWEHGKQCERCDKARLSLGLRPLNPEDWLSPGKRASGEGSISDLCPE